MTRKWLLPAFAAVVALQPALRAKSPEQVSGFLVSDASCPQTAYVLKNCPCDTTVLYHVFSTKVDLSRYADGFVSLRGSILPGNCQAYLFEASEATGEPNRPCPCPEASLDTAPSCPVPRDHVDAGSLTGPVRPR